MSLLVRLEDSFGIVPASDGSGLSLDPKAPHAPKAATAVKLWAEKRAARERRDRRPGIRGLESLAVAALRISQPMKPNQDAKLGGERRSHLCMLSFYSPLHPTAFSAHLGVNDVVAYTAAHYSTPLYFPWILPFSLGRRDSLLPINDQGKHRAETVKKPVEFDLSFADPETTPFRPRGQKPRVHSLGMNPYSHSSEYRPVPCCLETRGVNNEIAGERE